MWHFFNLLKKGLTTDKALGDFKKVWDFILLKCAKKDRASSQGATFGATMGRSPLSIYQKLFNLLIIHRPLSHSFFLILEYPDTVALFTPK